MSIVKKLKTFPFIFEFLSKEDMVMACTQPFCDAIYLRLQLRFVTRWRESQRSVGPRSLFPPLRKSLRFLNAMENR